MYEILHKGAKMIGDVLVTYTFRHRYTKSSNVHGIPLTNISAAKGLTTEVSHQSYLRFVPITTASTYTHSNARME